LPATKTEVFCSGLAIPGNTESNLVYKAWQLLNQEYSIAPVSIYLHKVVPMGAGLGGGSANGVAVLKACNSIFGLNLSTNQMAKYALELGSDCPFFVEQKPVLATGRGEVFQPIDLDLSGLYLLVVHPGFGVSTAQAFANANISADQPDLAGILSQPIDQWQALENAFEKSVFPLHPILQDIKQKMTESGAVYASMSGSGSAIFGLFKQYPGQIFTETYTQFLAKL
jgi:4-diphosphocytidyl-2-C-methyl-D-erythritol kinase